MILFDLVKYYTGWLSYTETVINVCTTMSRYNIFYIKFFQFDEYGAKYFFSNI